MFVRVWQFRVKPGSAGEFEEIYGPQGAWAQLFRRAAGYLGTELRPVPDASGEYQTVDRWDTRAAWNAFLERHRPAYESLDRHCDALIEREMLVSEE